MAALAASGRSPKSRSYQLAIRQLIFPPWPDTFIALAFLTSYHHHRQRRRGTQFLFSPDFRATSRVQYSGDHLIFPRIPKSRNPDLRLCKHQLQIPRLLYFKSLTLCTTMTISPETSTADTRRAASREGRGSPGDKHSALTLYALC